MAGPDPDPSGLVSPAPDLVAAIVALVVAFNGSTSPATDPAPAVDQAAATASVNPAGYRDGWQSLPAIVGGPRQEHAVAAVDGRVFVIGGGVPGPGGEFVTTDRVEAFDKRTGRWADTAPLPVPMNHANVANVGGRLFVLGGLSAGATWQALSDSFVYDPAADRWTPLPPLPPDQIRGSAAVGVRGTTVYLAGGIRSLTPMPGGLHDTVTTVSAYDTTTGGWQNLPPLPAARDHAGSAVIGDTFYLLGGRDHGRVNVSDADYALNLTTGHWSARTPMPTARGGVATAAVGERIYVLGGEGAESVGPGGVFDNVEVYDAARDRWDRLAPMPAPRHGTAAVAVAVAGTIYAPGGGNAAGGAPVDVHDAFRPAQG